MPAHRPMTASVSPASTWRSAVQSAPGRDVMPMVGQEFVPDTLALANGNIVVAGDVEEASRTRTPRWTLAVAELEPDGRLDPSFGDRGVALTRIKLEPWQMLALPDGRLLILGPSHSPGEQEPRITSFPDWQLLQLLPSGTPDPDFGHAGLLDVSGVPVGGEGADHEVAPKLAPNGDIVLPTVIGPLFSPTMVSGLVRVNPNGSRDTSFGSDGLVELPGGVAAFSVGLDGSVVAVVSQRSTELLLRLRQDGSLDPSFNDGAPLQLPFYSVDSMLVVEDGAIELHGYPSANRLLDSKISRYTPSGTLDASWGSAGVTDLGSSSSGGYLHELLPTSGGETLLVTMGVPQPPGMERSGVQITRLTAAGEIDPTLGGTSGLLLALPFGGGTYAPGTIANLHEDSLAPTGVIQRADGRLLFSGLLEASETIQTEGGPEPVAWFTGFALAALNSSYGLDTTFTGARPPRLTVRIRSTGLSPKGIAVQLGSSDAAIAVVTARAAGRTIAEGTVPFFSLDRTVTRQAARIPLTRAGRRLGHPRHLRVTVTVSSVDLAGNHLSAHASRVL